MARLLFWKPNKYLDSAFIAIITFIITAIGTSIVNSINEKNEKRKSGCQLTFEVIDQNKTLVNNVILMVDSSKKLTRKTDRDGEAAFDYTPFGTHSYFLNYDDSIYTDSFTLDSNSRKKVRVRSLSGGTFKDQWFKAPWTIQYEGINVQLVKRQADNRSIIVNICYDSKPYHSDDTLYKNVIIRLHGLMKFRYGNDWYYLFVKDIGKYGDPKGGLGTLMSIKKLSY